VLGGDITSTRIVTIVLVLISAAATYLTQILVTSKATTVPTGTAATVQKLMKVFIPTSVLFSGVFFPLGVLLYWFTSNTWTLLQQIYINRYHPPKPPDGASTGSLPLPQPTSPNPSTGQPRRVTPRSSGKPRRPHTRSAPKRRRSKKR
jgi:YidC/Oxa1 family membrane protein insertase